MSELKPKDRVKHIRLDKAGTCVVYHALKKKWKVQWDNGKSTFCAVKSLKILDPTNPKSYRRNNTGAASRAAAPKLPVAANTKVAKDTDSKPVAKGTAKEDNTSVKKEAPTVNKVASTVAPKMAANTPAALFVEGAWLRRAERHHDRRGFFQEMFNTSRDKFIEIQVSL